MHRYTPVDDTWRRWVVFGIGAVVLGGAGLFRLANATRHHRQVVAKRNEQARESGQAIEQEVTRGWFGQHGMLLGLIIVLGAPLLGGVTFLCWADTANALLDRSDPEYVPVAIRDFPVEDCAFVCRVYQIQYSFDQGAWKLFCTTPEHIEQFETDKGIAETHAGWLGWRWVKTIRPVKAPNANENG